MTLEFQSTIGDDVPVTVRCNIAPAEPDVGIMSAYAEDLEVLIDGKDMTGALNAPALGLLHVEAAERQYEDDGG